MDTNLIIKRFERGEGERREFEKGFFEVIELGGVTIGRAVYEPGWNWALSRPPARMNTWCWL